ncbi:MAG: hypothetical protein RLZZ141_1992, partial [Pseudomonadota bacterium]
NMIPIRSGGRCGDLESVILLGSCAIQSATGTTAEAVKKSRK